MKPWLSWFLGPSFWCFLGRHAWLTRADTLVTTSGRSIDVLVCHCPYCGARRVRIGGMML